jgi:hypothetical protein
MTRWVLDDGPLGALAIVLPDDWVPPCLSLHITESISQGAGSDKTGRRGRWVSNSDVHGHPLVTTHPLSTNDPGSKIVFEHLRTKSSSTSIDLGEDESIALCLTSLTDAVFVTMDKGAAYQALVELGPARVSSPFDLWDWLRGQELVSEKQFATLCDHVLGRDRDLAGIPLRYRRT